MEIRNKVSFTSYNPKIVTNELNTIKEGFKIAGKALSEAVDTDSVLKIKSDIEVLNSKIKDIKIFTQSNVKTPKTEKESKAMAWLTGVMKKVAGSEKFDKMTKDTNGLGKLLIWGNTGKELVGTTIYTVQALTNTDLPPDKRKFIGMYDLGVGVASTTLGAVAGLVMLKYQDKFVNWIVGGKAAKGLPNYARAFAGVAFFIPVVLQMILVKRIIAPAIATPIAGKLKAKLEAREVAKNGKQSVEIQPADLTVGLPKAGEATQSAGITNLLDKATILSVKA